jgi:hypothetical protein
MDLFYGDLLLTSTLRYTTAANSKERSEVTTDELLMFFDGNWAADYWQARR